MPIADSLDAEARSRDDTMLQREEFPPEKKFTAEKLAEMRERIQKCMIENKIARGETVWI